MIEAPENAPSFTTPDGKPRRIVFACLEGDAPGELRWLHGGNPMQALTTMVSAVEGFRAHALKWVLEQGQQIAAAPAALARILR